MRFDWLERLADRFAFGRQDITREWEEELPYLSRWYLSGRRNQQARAGVYLHRIQRSDYDEMHDHPWPFVSLILAGGYFEETPGPGWADGTGPRVRRWYGPGRLLVRPANWIHRIIIP